VPRHPPRDLLLDEDDDERRAPVVGEEALEKGRGDLIRKVRHDAGDGPHREPEQVDLERVRLDDLDVLVSR